MNPFPKKVIATIIIEMDNPYAEGNQNNFVKTEIARMLREFADIEESAYGGQRQVETYTDKKGNKLTNIVSLDYGCKIPYEKKAFED